MIASTLRNAWLVLLGLTLASLAITLAPGVLPSGAQAIAFLALGGLKAWLILGFFVGIDRHAGGWRAFFIVFLVLLCGLLIAVYTAGCVHHGVQCFSNP
ncbi:cytochrome C oxidase subunit IV family protein [Terrihabitans sp. B22-R8]|uniref:cytochrome C oxidase subunit IV family protein n=1 Tax=Terrihabitans sp. B22-R8 TaxID=3425128 RepID=UPI00403C0AFF